MMMGCGKECMGSEWFMRCEGVGLWDDEAVWEGMYHMGSEWFKRCEGVWEGMYGEGVGHERMLGE